MNRNNRTATTPPQNKFLNVLQESCTATALKTTKRVVRFDCKHNNVCIDNPIPKKVRKNFWLSKKDMQKVRNDVKNTLTIFRNNATELDENEHCFRGLESYFKRSTSDTSTTKERRKQHTQKILDLQTELLQQQQQHSAKVTRQIFHYYNDPNDQERIAVFSRLCSANATKQAIQRATRDRMALAATSTSSSSSLSSSSSSSSVSSSSSRKAKQQKSSSSCKAKQGGKTSSSSSSSRTSKQRKVIRTTTTTKVSSSIRTTKIVIDDKCILFHSSLPAVAA